MALGGWLGGFLFDVSGDCTGSIAAAILTTCVGIPLALALPRTRGRPQPARGRSRSQRPLRATGRSGGREMDGNPFFALSLLRAPALTALVALTLCRPHALTAVFREVGRGKTRSFDLPLSRPPGFYALRAYRSTRSTQDLSKSFAPRVPARVPSGPST